MAHQPGDKHTETSLQENLKAPSTWLRLLFMILFLALWGISRIVVLAVVVLQFFWVLIRGETNARLAGFGQSLATYTYQIVLYLTFSTEERPFPFSDISARGHGDAWEPKPKGQWPRQLRGVGSVHLDATAYAPNSHAARCSGSAVRDSHGQSGSRHN